MKAAVIRATGQPPVVGEHPTPQRSPGSSLVRVSVAPIAPLDLLCAGGGSYFGAPPVPYVPGVQGVGEVVDSAVLPAGARVWFATSAGMAPGDGSLAEYCAVADGDLVPIAANVDDAAVAALGLSAVAAWMVLTWRARLRAGEKVVVLGGGGAVGQAAIGAARVLGAERVVAVCRSGEAARLAVAAGADAVIAGAGDPHPAVLTVDLDDSRALADALRAACGGPADVVVDPVFGRFAEAAVEALGPGGRLVNLGGASDDRASFSSATLRSRSIDLLGYTNNSLTAEQRSEALRAVLEHAERGRMGVRHHVHRLDDAAAAWVLAAQGGAPGRRGRVVIAMTGY